MDGTAWKAEVHRVAQSQTRLKRLSMVSSKVKQVSQTSYNIFFFFLLSAIALSKKASPVAQPVKNFPAVWETWV